jgi:hypothetical protein
MAKTLNVEATHISSWPRHQWSDRKKVSMMYYFFCGITFVFNCVFYRRQAHVVLTSVDRLSIDDADGSIIDVLTMPDADVPRWQLICFYGITSTCVKTKIYLNQARTIAKFISSHNLVQCRINNLAFRRNLNNWTWARHVSWVIICHRRRDRGLGLSLALLRKFSNRS